jgi:5,10-methenyltetrahydrofolate synthetase
VYHANSSLSQLPKANSEPANPSRQALRQRLLAERVAFAAGPNRVLAQRAVAFHLVTLVATLEPRCLGVYWPVRGEFNAIDGILEAPIRNTMRLALPFVRKLPPRMEYRDWDGSPPVLRDEAGIPAAAGSAETPDVVLVPCLGFTGEGFRLGYGGGYFDRWLAANPDVTTVGVAWSGGCIDATQFQPEAHDIGLTLIVTEQGVA